MVAEGLGFEGREMTGWRIGEAERVRMRKEEWFDGGGGGAGAAARLGRRKREGRRRGREESHRRWGGSTEIYKERKEGAFG